LEASAGAWAWMISDEPAPTTMPPANNSAARLFRFMFAAFRSKLKKKKGRLEGRPDIPSRFQSGVICIGSGT
jgi:hypothetical protein